MTRTFPWTEDMRAQPGPGMETDTRAAETACEPPQSEFMEGVMDRDIKRTCRRVKAVADPTRLKILKLLQLRTACVCELTSVLGLAQPTVSRHLRQLEEGGFVNSERRGLRIDYMLAGEEAPVAARELLALIRKWHEEDKEIAALRRRLEMTVAESCDGPGGRKIEGQTQSRTWTSSDT